MNDQPQANVTAITAGTGISVDPGTVVSPATFLAMIEAIKDPYERARQLFNYRHGRAKPPPFPDYGHPRKLKATMRVTKAGS